MQGRRSMTIKEILEKAKQQGRTALNEVESKDVLKTIGIPTTETRLATSKEEAVAFAKAIGFPVVLKIVSQDVLHKSDSGGVKLNITNEEGVSRAYDEILTSVKKAVPSAKIEGVSVQNMARSGLEVIIGLSKDPQFGPVLMFGIGGILVEIMKDVAFRIVPLTRRDAREMIREIKGYPLLEGYRGMEPANIPLLEEMLLKVSNFAEENPDVREMDLNPVYAYRDNALAVDARIILD